MKANTIYIDEIGEVDFIRNKRSKKLRITVKSSGKVRISFPFRCSFSEAKDFVVQKAEIIRNSLEKIHKNKKIYDENTDFRTQNYRLIIPTLSYINITKLLPANNRSINSLFF